ncbi:RNA-binding protein [Embleya scabrispora]|uniref:RNA-binding protein n=1 Tax=Embleya scabrispora TaxID=159449 RepID=A0A1T3P533_9ACTN|nr:TROVE domain-containing protein [Embleya scabrispora]OPC84207.1 RNA-binding protein [Embleya scabrispora]
MSRFNTRSARPTVFSPVTTTGRTTTNHQGTVGHLRDARSELFLLAVANFVGTDTFYEAGGERDDRYTALVRTVAVEDPAWMVEFVRWLRHEANMRSAALVAAAETVKGRLDAGLDRVPTTSVRTATMSEVGARTLTVTGGTGYSRKVVDAALARADEPGELLGYWTARYGRAVPKPIKRGIADAVRRLYNERSLLKYDTASKGYRFGDVIELVHPAPEATWQGELFKHAIDRRHNRDEVIPDGLSVLQAAKTLSHLPVADRRAYVLNPSLVASPGGLAGAGFTWERLAGWLQGPMDAAAWAAIVPSMGYMALLRNLRNLDEAGVPDDVAERVAARLADPEEVARSGQFPFRFYAAHKAVQSLRWGHALEKALRASLANVPALPGRTLVLVDQSPSMFPGYPFSTANTSDITLADKAKLFGSALALRAADADLVGYGIANYTVPFHRSDAVLTAMGRFHMEDGTDTPAAIRDHYKNHDRVVIVTDEQTGNMWTRTGLTVDSTVPANVPVYTWNLAGYRTGHAPSGAANRHTFGGLTDAAFRMIPLLESGRSATWPWEQRAAA